jgi:hypothetical protein
MGYINSLPLPLWDGDWPVYDIEVETGMYRIDVCGMLEVRHISRCFTMKDATGKTHYVGDFELDPEEWEEREKPNAGINARRADGDTECGGSPSR